jgi:hypothetical protein
MATTHAAAAPSPADFQRIILELYEKRIAYYWRASSANKRSYKLTRFMTIVLGALVTLVSSISVAGGSASGGEAGGWVKTLMAVLTPILAATLAITGGVSQAFQWGAAWSDMVITATRLERERNRVRVTPPEKLDPIKEMALLDNIVLDETQGFFQRLFGSGGPAKSGNAQPQPADGRAE